jgi:hypothetical protein
VITLVERFSQKGFDAAFVNLVLQYCSTVYLDSCNLRIDDWPEMPNQQFVEQLWLYPRVDVQDHLGSSSAGW